MAGARLGALETDCGQSILDRLSALQEELDRYKGMLFRSQQEAGRYLQLLEENDIHVPSEPTP